MNNAPFTPQGGLTAILAATSAPTAIQLTDITGSNPCNIEVTNTTGGVDAFLVYADTAAHAATVAALGIPAAGSAQPSTFDNRGFMIHIPAGSDKIYSLPPNAFYTAITATGTTTLYLLPGDGQ
jgi:hypothetical protein